MVPLTYQWQKNGSNISGATSASYAAPATTIGRITALRLMSWSPNSAGAVTSNFATTGSKSRNTKNLFVQLPPGRKPDFREKQLDQRGTTGLDWSKRTDIFGCRLWHGRSGSSTLDAQRRYFPAPGPPTRWREPQCTYPIRMTISTREWNCSTFATAITAHRITGDAFNVSCASDASQYVQIVRWNGPWEAGRNSAGRTGPGLPNGDVVKATAVVRTLTCNQ